MSLTLADARTALDAAEAKDAELGLKVSIAVVDPHGDLVGAARLDGASYFTPEIARGKAMVSAMFRQPSEAVAERGPTPIGQRLNVLHNGALIFHQGAVPVTKGDAVVGAIGVSGALPQQDQEIAQAGASAV